MIDTTELTLEQAETTNGMTLAWWAVVSRFFLHGLIVSTWVTRIPAIQSSLALTNAALGLCLLGTAVGSAMAIPTTGWLVSRFGSKRVTAWSTIGFAAALIPLSWAANPAALFAALTIFGAMAGANDVAINAQAVAIENAMESPTMSRFHAMFSIGGMTGAGLGALIAAHAIAPRLHLVAASTVFVIAGFLTTPFLFDAQDDAPKRSRSLRMWRMSRVLLTLAAMGFCMFLSEGAIADWSGVYLKQVLNADQGLTAAAYAIFSFGMAAFRLIGDAMTTRLGPVQTLRAGALLGATGLTIALTVFSAPAALPGLALAGAGFSVIVPLLFAASGRVRPGGSGASVALVSGSGYLGFLIGPPLIGLIAQGSSLRIALFVVVALSLVTAMLARAVGERHAHA